jgi:hypothetical protein
MDPMNVFSAIRYENLYHMGLVVPGIGAAMARLSDQLGLTWAPVRTFPVRVADGGRSPVSLDVQATYSHQGPPYFELIEAIGDGIWSPAQAGQLHHLGIFVDDVAAEVRRLEAEGFVTELHGVLPDGGLGGPVYLRNSLGVRIELGGPLARDMVREWVGG